MAKIFFCGDIINQFCDTQFISHELRDIIAGCDYSVCNLEGVIAREGEGFSSMKQHFSTPKSLHDAGLDLALLANNHITDYGKGELIYTINKLKEHGLAYIGAGQSYQETYRIHYFNIQDLHFAIINICEAQGGQYEYQSKEYGHAWIGASCIESLIKEAKSKVDKLFLCVHAGLEHYQLPLEQFREIYRHYCEIGVDVVVGSHPHIVQGIEKYKESLIFYSLGNFYFPRKKDADYMTDIENQAFSVVVSAGKNELSYNVVYHRIENQMVHVSGNTPKIDADVLSEMLGANYSSILDKQLSEAFYRLPMNLLRISLNGILFEDGFVQKVKTMLRYLLNRKESISDKENRMKLLNHIVNNETYRYLITSVIERKLYK